MWLEANIILKQLIVFLHSGEEISISYYQNNWHYFSPSLRLVAEQEEKMRQSCNSPASIFSQKWGGVGIQILKILTNSSGNQFCRHHHGQAEQKQPCRSQPHTAVTCREVSKPPENSMGRTDNVPSHLAAPPKLPAELLDSVGSGLCKVVICPQRTKHTTR